MAYIYWRIPVNQCKRHSRNVQYIVHNAQDDPGVKYGRQSVQGGWGVCFLQCLDIWRKSLGHFNVPMDQLNVIQIFSKQSGHKIVSSYILNTVPENELPCQNSCVHDDGNIDINLSVHLLALLAQGTPRSDLDNGDLTYCFHNYRSYLHCHGT